MTRLGDPFESLPTSLRHGIALLSDNRPMKAAEFFLKVDTTPDALLLLLACRSLVGDPSALIEYTDGLKVSDDLTALPHIAIVCFACCALAHQSAITNANYLAEHIHHSRMSFGFGVAFFAVQKKYPMLLGWKSIVLDLISKLKVSIWDPLPAPTPVETPSEKRWRVGKERNEIQYSALTELMGMIGLETVKEMFIDVIDSVAIDARRGMALKDKRMNACFTGKTTLARLYARLLNELGVLNGRHCVETSGAKLVSEGVDLLKRHISTIENSGGGVLFIDEAYQLDPANDKAGRLVLDYLLTEIDDPKGSLVAVFAGYPDKIDKLIEHNPGINSRFPFKFKFEDYTDVQLLSIIQYTLKKKFGKMPFTVFEGINGKSINILVRRVAQMRGSMGFGNARSIQNAVEGIFANQARRVADQRRSGKAPSDFEITRTDILGEDPGEALETCEAWQKLQGMIGLDTVKANVQAMVEVVKTNFELENIERPLMQLTLNRLFLGNPGTGKTVVAKLFGEILKAIGMLSNGEVVVKNASDFIGSVIGESEKNTRAILGATKGKVLIIDEAYSLFPGLNHSCPFKTSVVDTLVAEIQNVPGEDRCVLMIGYTDRMEEFIKNANPGLSRRFNMSSAFVFNDYSDSELVQILNLKLFQKKLTAEFESQRAALDVLNKKRMQTNFGNGGDVESLIAEAVSRMAQRNKLLSAVDRAKDTTITALDFNPTWNGGECLATLNIPNLLKDMLSANHIIGQFETYKNSVDFANKRGHSPHEHLPMCFKFVGPPGTGKTTIAGKIGKLFRELGVLSTDRVVEATPTDFIAQYIGHTAKKTRDKMNASLGMVLLIDEAYGLNGSRGGQAFAEEAVNELVALIEKPQFKNKIVIVLAGYENDIAALMTSNPGLSSRFSETVRFDPISPRISCDMLIGKLKANEIIITGFPAVRAKAETIFSSLAQTSGWGNGRDIATMSVKIMRLIAMPSSADTSAIVPGQDIKFSGKALLSFMENFLSERSPVLQHKKPIDESAFANDGPITLNAPKTSALTVTKTIKPPIVPKDKQVDKKNDTDGHPRHAGVHNLVITFHHNERVVL